MFELTINDKVVMLQFGMHHAQAISQLGEKVQAGEVMEYEYLLGFIYAAHENHCKRHEVPVKVTRAELFAWMEDNNYAPGQAELYTAIMQAYQATLPQVQQQQPAQKKSKPTGKK